MSSGPGSVVRAAVRHRSAATAGVRGVIGLGVLALAVQLLAVWGPRRWQIPSLDRLAAQVDHLIVSDPGFATALLHTLETVVLALLVALGAGVGLGLLTGLSRTAYRIAVLPLELLRPVPAVAAIPVMILALGQGMSMEVAVCAFGAWWPIFFNTLYGTKNVDPVTVQTARVFGLTPVSTIIRVIVPSILPMIVTALRIAAPLALIVAVGAEYLATAGHGLGGVLIKATSTGDLQVLWGAAVITGILGIVLGALVWVVGKLLCPWSAEW